MFEKLMRRFLTQPIMEEDNGGADGTGGGGGAQPAGTPPAGTPPAADGTAAGTPPAAAAAAPQGSPAAQPAAGASQPDLKGAGAAGSAATDKKPADGKQPGDAEVADVEKLVIPEGYKISDEVKAEIKNIAAAKKMSQTEVQGLVDKHISALKAVQEAETAQSNQIISGWEGERTEYLKGKDEAQVAANINTAYDALGIAGLKDFLEATQVIKSRQVTELLDKVGALSKTHKFVGGAAAGGKTTFTDMAKPD